MNQCKVCVLRRRDGGRIALAAQCSASCCEERYNFIPSLALSFLIYQEYHNRQGCDRLTSLVFTIIPKSSARMRLKTCCGCFSLQTGTIAIGSMSFVWAILSAISAFPLLDVWKDYTHDLVLKFLVKSFLTAVMIYVVVIATMAGLMIYGAQSKKPAFVFPWLAISTTDFLVWGSITLGGVTTAPTMFPIKWFFIFLTISSVYIGLHFYVWLIVYSFYRQIVAEKYRDGIPLTDVESLNHLKNGYQA